MTAITAPRPDEAGVHDGLAYELFLPPAEPIGGVVILHGAGSSKESHRDYAGRCRQRGLAAATFDQRGHGTSTGALDGRMAADVATIAGLLPAVPIALRGSSMGGYLALVAAREACAAAVVTICPAPASGLLMGLMDGRFSFRSDAAALGAFLEANDEHAAAAALTCPLLLLHAAGDEVVPVELSRRLAVALGPERCRYEEIPAGDHRSIQHDPLLQDLSISFLRSVLER